MPDQRSRIFSRGFKLDAVSRMAAGENVETLAHDAASNRLATIGIERYKMKIGIRTLDATSTHAYTYDPAGNATNRNRSDGVDYDFVHGDGNRLATVSNEGNSAAIYRYVYDAAGRRVLRQTNLGSPQRLGDMIFLYDLSGRLLAARKRGGGWWNQFFRIGGMAVAERRNGTNFHILSDHLGTPKKYLDQYGGVNKSVRLRPFGDVEASSDIYQRFPGQYDDPDTWEIYQNGFRDYDPWAGRYLQSDPIGLQGGWNTYAYVGGNPVMRVDPRGLEFKDSKFMLAGAYYGLCFLICLAENGNMFEQAFGNAAAAAQFGNVAGNAMAGPTGRTGVGGIPSHPTSWQHKLGSRFGSSGSRIGRFAGRAAIGVTLADGALNFVVAVGCLNKCVNDLGCVLSGGNAGAPPSFDGVSP